MKIQLKFEQHYYSNFGQYDSNSDNTTQIQTIRFKFGQYDSNSDSTTQIRTIRLKLGQNDSNSDNTTQIWTIKLKSRQYYSNLLTKIRTKRIKFGQQQYKHWDKRSKVNLTGHNFVYIEDYKFRQKSKIRTIEHNSDNRTQIRTTDQNLEQQDTSSDGRTK